MRLIFHGKPRLTMEEIGEAEEETEKEEYVELEEKKRGKKTD